MLENYTGELAGLGAALAWAIASVLFRRLGSHVAPLALNLYKGVIATGMLLSVLAIRPDLVKAIDAGPLTMLLLSGAIGIGIGDTAFFAALNRLGERRTVLMAETLTPPMAILIAFIFLAEVLSLYAMLGIAITVAGVSWVIMEGKPDQAIDRVRARWGIVFGLTAALCQSLGAVISRGAMNEAGVDPIYSSLVRIVGGIAILLIWIPATRQSFFPPAVRSGKLWAVIAGTTFIGTFLGIILQQTALKHTPAGIAQTLLGTSSLFILPLVVVGGEKISLRAIAGAVIAVAGIAILFAVE